MGGRRRVGFAVVVLGPIGDGCVLEGGLTGMDVGLGRGGRHV